MGLGSRLAPLLSALSIPWRVEQRFYVRPVATDEADLVRVRARVRARARVGVGVRLRLRLRARLRARVQVRVTPARRT